MNYYEIMHKVESSSDDDWTVVDGVFTNDHTSLAIFHEDVAVSLGWGKDHQDGESWTEAWSKGSGFPDSKIYGFYLDVRYNGVVINRDLILSVDGGRGYLPSGSPIAEQDKGIVGMKVGEPEMKRAKLVDLIAFGRQSQFDRYSDSANINPK